MTSKTPAMILQELSIKTCGQGPNYELITQHQGTHENLFEYVVDVLGISATGRGRSKKEAKQETAKNALLVLNKQHKIEDIPQNLAQSSSHQLSPDNDGELPSVRNYIGELDDRCLINNLPEPKYELIFDDGPSHQKVFTFQCHVMSISTKSTASTKKQARQNTAKMMLKRLDGIIPALPKEHENDQLKLCDSDTVVSDIYQELVQVRQSHLNVKIMDLHGYLRQLLEEKKLTYDDIKEYFQKQPSEENLQEVLNKLELKLYFEDLTNDLLIQGDTYAAAAIVNSVTPLTKIAIGNSLEAAKFQALKELFETIDIMLKPYSISKC